MVEFKSQGVINRDSEAELEEADLELVRDGLERMSRRKSGSLKKLISSLTPEERQKLLKELLAEQDNNKN